MKTYKSEAANQYQNGMLTICSLRRSWMKLNGVTLDEPTLFYGSVYDTISRKLAAGMLRQFRKDRH